MVLKKLSLLLIIILPLGLRAQTLQGKVYDSTATIKGVKIFNKTQNTITATDDKGEFNIPAQVGDTLAFESLFHHPKVEILKPFHFQDTAVFELKKVINTLDEVEILSDSEQPLFNEETYSVELRNLIKSDIEKHPEKYQPGGPSYGVNFLAIFGLVAKLFKNKDKYTPPVHNPISYRQMDSLFSNSSFFNEKLLTESLNIPKKRQQLFLEFCSAKQLTSRLLERERKMELLEELVLNSQLFLILLEEYGKEAISKE
ncbi:hypothetical protein J4050_11600 [Winogradskyella sp. DF17]|uniref:CarboxypepD_reg-like domain-containing protein n=1 Tax=Winogradskyella pelagia TaxID=2819984 RepID=A0ABS3T3S5_9FLAO|nr:hypothetical protein [Winogradskyella sp. DF17]MBO3117397.1 hypothetical protein [Winogradskyella sp. DF17]